MEEVKESVTVETVEPETSSVQAEPTTELEDEVPEVSDVNDSEVNFADNITSATETEPSRDGCLSGSIILLGLMTIVTTKCRRYTH